MYLYLFRFKLKITEDLGRIYIKCTSEEAKGILYYIRTHVVINKLKTKVGDDGLEVAGKINHLFFLRSKFKI